MFVGKIIENSEYYKIRNRVNIYFGIYCMIIAPLFLILILCNCEFVNKFVISLVNFIMLIIIVTLKYHVQKKIKNAELMGKHIIKIDKDTIHICSAKNDKEIEEKINIQDANLITVKKDYKMPGEKFIDFFKIIFGKYPKNFIKIQTPDTTRNIYFYFDTYYMLNELKNIIKNWEIKGYNIKYTN